MEQKKPMINNLQILQFWIKAFITTWNNRTTKKGRL